MLDFLNYVYMFTLRNLILCVCVKLGLIRRNRDLLVTNLFGSIVLAELVKDFVFELEMIFLIL